MSTVDRWVRNHGGYLVRVLNTLDEFRVKHGSWPTRLLLSADALEVLRDHHLTPLGFRLLQARVRLVPTDREVLVAEDDEGRSLDYSTEGWSGKEPDQRATDWLGYL